LSSVVVPGCTQTVAPFSCLALVMLRAALAPFFASLPAALVPPLRTMKPWPS
jgi:hypothetical protein